MYSLYSARLKDALRPSESPVRVYTHAYSHKQAVRNFCVRYPYPPYVFERVTNEETGVEMTENENS